MEWGVFLFFLVLVIIMTLFVAACLPETRGGASGGGGCGAVLQSLAVGLLHGTCGRPAPIKPRGSGDLHCVIGGGCKINKGHFIKLF
jgi:hypothetical protein